MPPRCLRQEVQNKKRMAASFQNKLQHRTQVIAKWIFADSASIVQCSCERSEPPRAQRVLAQGLRETLQYDFKGRSRDSAFNVRYQSANGTNVRFISRYTSSARNLRHHPYHARATYSSRRTYDGSPFGTSGVLVLLAFDEGGRRHGTLGTTTVHRKMRYQRLQG